MAYAVHAVEHGWAGDLKRNLVVVTLSATNDEINPLYFGLREIKSIRPTLRTGTVQGVASVTIATLTDLALGASNTYVLNAAAAKIELEVLGK
jgi:hypothetical protein